MPHQIEAAKGLTVFQKKFLKIYFGSDVYTTHSSCARQIGLTYQAVQRWLRDNYRGFADVYYGYRAYQDDVLLEAISRRMSERVKDFSDRDLIAAFQAVKTGTSIKAAKTTIYQPGSAHQEVKGVFTTADQAQEKLERLLRRGKNPGSIPGGEDEVRGG